MNRIGITMFALFFLLFYVANCVLAQESPKAEPESKFQAAQRHIFTATNLLEAYIRENPDGKDSAVAKLQLKALNDLNPSSTPVLPVEMANSIGHFRSKHSSGSKVEWWVASVDARRDKTTVTLKIKNTAETGVSAIYAPDVHPLVMVDNNGEFYPMQQSPLIPTGVEGEQVEKKMKLWWFQAQRVLTVRVVFAPLALDATGGRILYKDDNKATPAEFSLTNKTAQRGPTP